MIIRRVEPKNHFVLHKSHISSGIEQGLCADDDDDDDDDDGGSSKLGNALILV
jgi:hypothetical protein